MNWLKTFLEETPGIGSSSRLTLLLAVAICLFVPMGVWAYLSVTTKAMVVIDSTISTFCLGAFGAAAGAKVFQAVKGE